MKGSGEFVPFSFFINYAYICMWIRQNLKETVLKSIITWPTLGKQNMQTKEVYYPWRLQILMRYWYWSLHVIIGRSVHWIGHYVYWIFMKFEDLKLYRPQIFVKKKKIRTLKGVKQGFLQYHCYTGGSPWYDTTLS